MVAIFHTLAVAATFFAAGAQAVVPVKRGEVRSEIMKRAGICFDFGDCLIQGGGDCVWQPGGFLGTCVTKSASSSKKATSTKKAISSSAKVTKTSASASPSSTGVCFDFFDCLLFGGGDCVNFKCVKKT